MTGQSATKEESQQSSQQKNCSSPEGPLQPIFRNKKSQAPYLQTLVFSHI